MLHFNQIQAMHLAGIKILETCPSCGFADIPADEERVFRCLNAECMKETCRYVNFLHIKEMRKIWKGVYEIKITQISITCVYMTMFFEEITAYIHP